MHFDFCLDKFDKFIRYAFSFDVDKYTLEKATKVPTNHSAKTQNNSRIIISNGK
jgi:hypothetical protein